MSKLRIRASGMKFLTEAQINLKLADNFAPTINGILHAMCEIMRNVIELVVKVENGIMIINAR